MTGGPGCSGMLALFVENGPYKVDAAGDLSLNPNSWNSNANVIWIDQPVGSGFSYSDKTVDNVTSEKAMATDVYAFLNGFFEKHPELRANDFYIVGESYGGHYVPALGAYVYNQNLSAANKVNLKGIGIGNGLVDPVLQYPKYSDYLYDNKVINAVEKGVMKAALPVCTLLIKGCSTSVVGRAACDAAVEYCNLTQVMPLLTLTGKNNYDIRLKCDKLPLCYDFSAVENFLNNKATIAAIGAKKDHWESCNHVANLALTLSGDWMLSYAEDVKLLLENGVRALVYSGDKDFICNWEGGYAWASALDWKFKSEFNALKFEDYKNAQGEVMGQIKSYDSFSFFRVYNAGHMVPMDQPEHALYMINQFIAPSKSILE